LEAKLQTRLGLYGRLATLPRQPGGETFDARGKVLWGGAAILLNVSPAVVRQLGDLGQLAWFYHPSLAT